MVTDTGYHDPVMVREVLEHLEVEAEGLYLDGTVGGGGHTRRILEASSSASGRRWTRQAVAWRRTGIVCDSCTCVLTAPQTMRK